MIPCVMHWKDFAKMRESNLMHAGLVCGACLTPHILRRLRSELSTPELFHNLTCFISSLLEGIGTIKPDKKKNHDAGDADSLLNDTLENLHIVLSGIEKVVMSIVPYPN